jgi:peptidoglycan/LPS O-acetylase OafA/YrhL
LKPVRLKEGLLLWLIPSATIFLSIRIDALNESSIAFLLSGIGAIFIVALTLSSNPISNRVLASGWAVWFGKISYSLYLLHIPVLLTVVHLFYGNVPVPLLFVIGSLIAIFLAWMMAITVERYSQRLGRWLAKLYMHRPVRSVTEARATVVGRQRI